ncbi:MAG: RidA family protein [Kiritimatiellae bacterium]|nr:RidA family protein [Kiritimatiellia bacterium]
MQRITTPDAPEAIGPYSQAIDAGNIIFCSGQIPLDPNTMTLVEGDIAEQTRQVLSNLQNVLAEAGLTLNNVAKTTVFLSNLDDFSEMNAVYATCFGNHKPARATVQVTALPLGAKVEIEAIAMRTHETL